MKSLHAHLSALAAQQPDQAAIITCDEQGNVLQELSYKGLLQRIEIVARYFLSQGLVSGDHIALSMENCPELLIASWAAWSSGIVTVPLDLKRDTGELSEYKRALSSAKIVLTKKDVVAIEDVGTEKVIEWKNGLEHNALVLFTSGTTARPKGALLTLGNLAVNADSIKEWLHITSEDRFLVQLPLHHINSTTFCLATLLAGGSIVIPPRYSNSHFFGQIAKTGATLTSIVQSILFDQVRRKEEYNAVRGGSKLNRIQIGSAPVVASVVQEFIREFNIPIYQGYGQTETALRVTGVPMDLPKPLYETLIAENSIGTPLPWAKLEILDESGAVLGEHTEGELGVQGPAVMRGYLGGEPAFRDGYFLTGDIGFYRIIGGKRFFFLRGRKKEMIIKGGINISPIAVENSLKNISPYIDQVYCFGVADERYGEEVAAAVCFKEGSVPEDAMRGFKFSLLRGTPLLSAYETPRYLLALSVAELPTTSTGKIQRTVLKERIPRERFESLYELFKTDTYAFTIITAQSPCAEASRVLHNHCWQPLAVDKAAYKKYLSEYLTLAAIDREGALAGQISFSYQNSRITCVSICSAAFKPRPVPAVGEIPDSAFVQKYVLAGHDPVINFHQKLGAEVVEVVPNSRPQDKSSLGYTVLLRYPATKAGNITSDIPVSHQLIQAVRLLADGEEVFALSRPGALAAYVAKQK